jgi:hypothetical protein
VPYISSLERTTLKTAGNDNARLKTLSAMSTVVSVTASWQSACDACSRYLLARAAAVSVVPPASTFSL